MAAEPDMTKQYIHDKLHTDSPMDGQNDADWLINQPCVRSVNGQ